MQGRLEGAFFFACGAVLFVLLGTLWRPSPEIAMIDFDAVYYASQTALHHVDPYNPTDLQRTYMADEAHADLVMHVSHHLADAVTLCVNAPSALLLMAPLAMLPWGVAHAIWMTLTVVSVLTAGLLMWEVGAAWGPRIAGLMVGCLLFGQEIALETGNAAGLAASLCVIAVWCFLQRRFQRIGVACMAMSLALKPQDAFLVWLFLLFAGGIYRKRAWHSAAGAAVLVALASIWMSSIGPHWMDEWRTHIAQAFAPGEVNDPAAKTVEPGLHGAMVVSLQTVTALYTSDPHLYNGLAYAICIPLLAFWAIYTFRAGGRADLLWMALSVIAPLSMLPVYHRQHDLLLLLLAVPGCAMLWDQRATMSRMVAGFMVAAVFLAGGIALQLEGAATFAIRISAAGLEKKLLTTAVGRPVPVLLFAMSVLSLWRLTVCFDLRPSRQPGNADQSP